MEICLYMFTYDSRASRLNLALKILSTNTVNSTATSNLPPRSRPPSPTCCRLPSFLQTLSLDVAPHGWMSGSKAAHPQFQRIAAVPPGTKAGIPRLATSGISWNSCWPGGRSVCVLWRRGFLRQEGHRRGGWGRGWEAWRGTWLPRRRRWSPFRCDGWHKKRTTSALRGGVLRFGPSNTRSNSFLFKRSSNVQHDDAPRLWSPLRKDPRAVPGDWFRYPQACCCQVRRKRGSSVSTELEVFAAVACWGTRNKKKRVERYYCGRMTSNTPPPPPPPREPVQLLTVETVQQRQQAYCKDPH